MNWSSSNKSFRIWCSPSGSPAAPVLIYTLLTHTINALWFVFAPLPQKMFVTFVLCGAFSYKSFPAVVGGNEKKKKKKWKNRQTHFGSHRVIDHQKNIKNQPKISETEATHVGRNPSVLCWVLYYRSYFTKDKKSMCW